MLRKLTILALLALLLVPTGSAWAGMVDAEAGGPLQAERAARDVAEHEARTAERESKTDGEIAASKAATKAAMVAITGRLGGPRAAILSVLLAPSEISDKADKPPRTPDKKAPSHPTVREYPGVR